MDHLSNYFKSIVYHSICSRKHSCLYLVIIYVFAAISIILLLLVAFFIFMKIQEKNRLRTRQLMEQRRRAMLRSQLQQLRQDSIISYEAAVQSKNNTNTLAQINETTDEFVLPSYDEALKLKNISILV